MEGIFVALSYSEQRQRESAKKEQRRAERLGVKSAATGEKLVATLSRGRQISSEDLKRMEMAVGIFRDGGPELERVLDNMKRHQAVLYKMVEDELKGDWMTLFGRLIASIPKAREFRPFSITWPEWRQFGMEAGMNEEEVVQALKVMLVFRDR